MIISTKDLITILELYGVTGTIEFVNKIQNCSSNVDKIRLIYQIDTSEGQKLICKANHEVNYPQWLIEKQSHFAMFLYNNGIPTAKKLTSNNKYCIKLPSHRLNLDVTLEEYAGQDLKNINLDTFCKFGELLGKIHSISEHYTQHIGFSATYTALSSGKATYKNILRHTKKRLPNIPEVNKAAILHDTLVGILRSRWKQLPQGTVHDDIGIFNNLVIHNNKIAVIDFNMAGEDVYLVDLLASYYSSYYKYYNNLSSQYENALIDFFMKGYTTYRKLTLVEELNFPIISSLMRGIFYTKLFIDNLNSNIHMNIIDIVEHFSNILNIFLSGTRGTKNI